MCSLGVFRVLSDRFRRLKLPNRSFWIEALKLKFSNCNPPAVAKTATSWNDQPACTMFNIYFSPNILRDLRKSLTLDPATFKSKLLLLKQVISFGQVLSRTLFKELSLYVLLVFSDFFLFSSFPKSIYALTIVRLAIVHQSYHSIHQFDYIKNLSRRLFFFLDSMSWREWGNLTEVSSLELIRVCSALRMQVLIPNV